MVASICDLEWLAHAMNGEGLTRFVVLHHLESTGSHFDLMILQGEYLATWKCADPPETAAASGLACTRIADHRTVYLEYEGPISGNRGEVRRYDQGNCRILRWDADGAELEFDGLHLRGRYLLRQSRDNTHEWRLERSGA